MLLHIIIKSQSLIIIKTQDVFCYADTLVFLEIFQYFVQIKHVFMVIRKSQSLKSMFPLSVFLGYIAVKH